MINDGVQKIKRLDLHSLIFISFFVFIIYSKYSLSCIHLQWTTYLVKKCTGSTTIKTSLCFYLLQLTLSRRSRHSSLSLFTSSSAQVSQRFARTFTSIVLHKICSTKFLTNITSTFTTLKEFDNAEE